MIFSWRKVPFLLGILGFIGWVASSGFLLACGRLKCGLGAIGVYFTVLAFTPFAVLFVIWCLILSMRRSNMLLTLLWLVVLAVMFSFIYLTMSVTGI